MVSSYFNLSRAERDIRRTPKKRLLVIYDISDSKRRKRLSDLLEGYGRRLQRSSFDCKLGPKQYKRLLRDLENFYDPEEGDNIAIYPAIEKELVYLNELPLHPDDEPKLLYVD